MRKFKDRIKFYLIGFGMGIIAVAFMFGKRGCAWLPENRVKNSIFENEIIYGDSIKDLMYCSNISSENIYDLLDSGGDVDFSESIPNESPKKYVIYGKNELRVIFALYDNYSEIIEVNTDCQTKLTNNTNKQTVPLPKNIISSIIESHAFTFYKEAECEINCFDIDEQDVKDFHLSATINMTKSVPWPKGSGENVSNKLYYLDGDINGVSYGIMYEIGENRTRIKHIIGTKDCDCY